MTLTLPSETVDQAATVTGLTMTKSMPCNVLTQGIFREKIVWPSVLFFVYCHVGAAYGFNLIVTGQLISITYSILWCVFLYIFGILGVTAGCHRLWAHRSYKAKWPLRSLLMLMQSLVFQKSIYEWVRDHRVHHKFMDTDADPHNIKRGFCFAHLGWLMMRKHPDVRAKGASIDLSDLERDPVVMFQEKYYNTVLVPIIAGVMPTVVPVLLWGESAWAAWHVCTIARYVVSLNCTVCINSVAHMWGMHPIDRSISPTNNAVMAHITLGEGWHNYHHVFPWDYKTAELGKFNGNVTAAFIEFFARVGLAYDLKTVPQEMIDRRMLRTGDGSHPRAHQARGNIVDSAYHDRNEDVVWGWGDKDMPKEDTISATVLNKAKRFH